MKPISQTLKGFRGIRDGLGLDELTLDFEALGKNAELIAILGPNGSGKTTVMDNMHPFLVMPSRAGADGLGAFSYYDHVVLPENVKEFVFTHNGERYRSEVVIRVNGKKKTEAYLYVLHGGRWEPVQLGDGTISDGKVDTYRRCVEDIVGSEETFFISQFSAQGKRQLASFKNGEIKTLLADLLGLEPIRAIGAQAAETAKLLKVGLAGLRQEQAGMEAEAGQIASQIATLGDTQAVIEARSADKLRVQGVLQGARATLTQVQMLRDTAAQTEARRTQLTLERTTCISQGRQAVSQCDEQNQREATRLADLNRRVAQRIQTANTRRQGLQQQQTRLSGIVQGARSIARAQRRLPLAQKVITFRETRLSALRETLESLDFLLIDGRSIADRCNAIEREAGQASLKAEDLARRLGLTEEVPCAGSDFQGKCKLLGDAVEAKRLVPSAKADVSRLHSELQTARASGVDIQRQVAGLLKTLGVVDVQGSRTVIARAERVLERARKRQSRLAAMTARQGEIDQAREQLALVAEELRPLLAQQESETVEEAGERQAIAASQASIAEQRTKLAAQYRRQLDAVDQALVALPAAFDQSRIVTAESAVHQAESAVQQAEQDYLGAIRSHQVGVEAGLRLAEARQRLAEIQARVAHVEQHLGKWTLFAKCMSNDGLIALSIDDAGPSLARLANELLLACYGPRFTVSIKTQVENAKGELREGFDIIVNDADSGDSKSVTLMSGGERVWINECLTRAIAIYLAQNSGRQYETLFSDEADGPLDPERKRMFMAMKREVLHLGGYEQEYFVSQTPELTAMADAVIDLTQFAATRV